MKKEITLQNNKDNKIWRFIIETETNKSTLKIIVGANLKHKNIYVFEDEFGNILKNINLDEFSKKIKENGNIFFMKMNFDKLKIYNNDITFLSIKSSLFKLVNFVV
jgi:hypothetical protein